MSQERDLLDREIGTPPLSTVNVDAVMARQRRRVRLQGAGLVVAAATPLVVVLGLLPQWRHSTAAVQPAAARPPAPASAPARLTPRQREAARLTRELQRLVAAALPGTQVEPIPENAFSLVHGTPTAVFPRQALVFADEGHYFLAGAYLRDSAGVSTLTVRVGKEDGNLFLQTRACSGAQPRDMRVHCDVAHGAGGTLTQLVSSSSKFTQFQAFGVDVLRRDGNVVAIHLDNSTDTAENEAFRHAPALTLAQVRALAGQPGLATTLP